MKFQLLNIDSNAKTVKGQEQGFMTAILYLMPSNGSGVEMCPMAFLAKCIAACLNTAGRGGIASDTFELPNGDRAPDNTVQRARLRRTLWFINDLPGFLAQLIREIQAFIRKAKRKGLIPCVRLNGTSDIRWEDIVIGDYANIFAMFADTQFYDYTKIPNRRRALGIPNYHLTFSYSHHADFAPIVVKALENYGASVNYAVVFRKALPATFLGRPVVSGDDSDLRFGDDIGQVVGLVAKGKGRRDKSGFIVG